jgi:hypothetical protein
MTVDVIPGHSRPILNETKVTGNANVILRRAQAEEQEKNAGAGFNAIAALAKEIRSGREYGASNYSSEARRAKHDEDPRMRRTNGT